MHQAASDRYERIACARCGRSGLRLPRISLGLWQNFGGSTPFENAREMVLKSFDHGVTHFDLANNYALDNARFSQEEMDRIDRHALDGDLNIWAASGQSD